MQTQGERFQRQGSDNGSAILSRALQLAERLSARALVVWFPIETVFFNRACGEGRSARLSDARSGRYGRLLDSCHAMVDTKEAVYCEGDDERFLLAPIVAGDGLLVGAFCTAARMEVFLPTFYRELHGPGMLLSSLVHLLPEIVWTARPSGEVDFVSHRWYEYTGRSPLDPGGMEIFGALHPDDVEGALQRWEAARAQGVRFETRLRIRDAAGAYRWQNARAAPLRTPGGSVIKWIGSLSDVESAVVNEQRISQLNGELHESENAWRFLAEGGRALAGSFDREEVLRATAHIAAGALWECCLIHLVRKDGGVECAAIATRAGGNGAVRGRVGHAAEAPVPASILEVLQTREHSLWSEVPADVRAMLNDFEACEGHGLCVPLLVRDRAFGTITLVSSRPVGAFDVTIARELAERAALALENAELYQREHSIADMLQRALLPAQLPALDGFDLDAVYVPAGRSTLVGGDWYDAFLLRDGRVGISVGDASGHGIEASVAMISTRLTIRAAALRGAAPFEVLGDANRMLLASGPEPPLVSAIYGVLDSAAHTLELVCAGHPPPFIAASGSVRPLRVGGFPLGVCDDYEATPQTFALEPASMVVFYTDGIVEETRDLIEGERALMDAIAAQEACATSPAADIVRRVLDDTAPKDDVAVMVLRAR